MKKITSLALAAIAAGAIGCASQEGHQAAQCMDDMPCWNWVTMGNGARGVTLKSGQKVVVNACQYDRLRDQLAKNAPKLKGDAQASCQITTGR